MTELLDASKPQSEEVCRACSQGRILNSIRVPDFEYGLDGARYGQCAVCGSFTQVPMPDGAHLSACYPAEYHSFLPASAVSRWRQAMRISQLRRLGDIGEAPVTVLDFGCGQGMFLDALAESGQKGRFFGYELGERNEREERYGGKVVIYRGDPDYFWNELPPIDLITMNHVIEHLPDPAPTVRRIALALAPGGRLAGQTPNADCYERDLFKLRWSGYHSPRHTVVFTKKGLNHLLHGAGFAHVDVTSGFNPASWAVSLGSMTQSADRPTGVRRAGLWWLVLVAAALVPAFIESRTDRSGIMDFSAAKAVA